MAYSGLGAGTQADPYQITTVSQFKEMDSLDYSNKYFKLVNNLDFASEVSANIPNFYCHLDGGGYKINNIPLTTTSFIRFRAICTVKNINLVFDRFELENVWIFDSTVSTALTLQNINVLCLNKDGKAVTFFGIALRAGSIASNLKLEGNFNRVFGAVYSNIDGLIVYNSNAKHVPLIKEVSAPITLSKCVYYKPFTYTTDTANKGLIANDTSAYKLTITNTAVIVSMFIDDSSPEYNQFVGCFVGRGKMDILNSYAFGYFKSKGAKYMHALFGGYSSTDCVLTNNYFYGDILTLAPKADNNVVSSLPTTGCYYCKELLTNQTYTDGYATNLSVLQFREASNFVFDFVSTWQQGVDRPLLISISEDLSQFDEDSLLDSGPISIGAVQKVSGTEYSVEVLTDNTKNYGVDITEFGVVVATRLNENGVLTFTTDDDIEAVIKTFYKVQDVKIFTDSVNYYHVHLEQIEVTDVVVDKYSELKIGLNFGSYIHGSVLVGEYLYGSSRNIQASLYSSIVKALASDVSQFQLFPIKTTDTAGSFSMDSLVKVGNKLYTVARDGSLKVYMIVFDLLTDDYQSYLIGTGTTDGAPSCTDGQYIYVYLSDPSRMCKIDPAVFNSTEKYNTASVWPVNSLDLAESEGLQYVHSTTVDESHLYVGLRPDLDSLEGKIWKVDKGTMLLILETSVPPMTDDMCLNDTHLFVGIEQRTATSPGYNVGCCAIRKSDLRVTQIRKLHTTDTADVKSYASLIFGNYLIDLKTNSRIYALDISDPDSWDNDDMGSHTLKVYKMLKPDGVTLTKPINEVCLTEDGKFVGFAWDYVSFVTSFDLSGLNYFAEPTVATIDAAIVGDNDVSLAGFITNTGGKTVTAIGVILGQASDLSDGVDYPVTPVTTEFEKAFNDLEYGTYYFRVYATNAEGTGYGDIKSFTLEIPYTEPGQPTDLEKAIQAEITISWTAPIDDGGAPVTGYKIERKASDGDWAVIIADTGSTATTYTETLPQGVYQYRVSAITAYTTGQPSAILDVNAVVGGGGMYRIYLGSTEIATIG